MSPATDTGPVLFAYDGSDLAKHAIEEAGTLLGTGQDAVVLTVWQRFDLGFIPNEGDHPDAADSEQVRTAAEHVAANGSALAESAGFHAVSASVEGSQTPRAISAVANERGARLIVLGSHGRTRLIDKVLGSVAAGVAAHSRRSVLIVHAPEETD